MIRFEDLIQDAALPRSASYQGRRVFPINPAAPPRRFPRARFEALPAEERMSVGDLHFRLWPNYPASRPVEGWHPRSFRWREVVLNAPARADATAGGIAQER